MMKPLTKKQKEELENLMSNDLELTEQEERKYIHWLLNTTDTPYEEIQWLLEDCGNAKIGEIKEIVSQMS